MKNEYLKRPKEESLIATVAADGSVKYKFTKKTEFIHLLDALAEVALMQEYERNLGKKNFS